jgi:serine/threonine protein kinase
MAIAVGIIVRRGDEEWVIDQFIAAGGFGKVFHATRRKPSPMEAAIKIPADHVLADPILSKKFEREARILANLEHPNVVKVIEVWNFKKTGEKALVQEFVQDRKTLSQHLADPNNDRVSALLQALYGLRAIHGTEDKGVIHRDVAPQNLLVSGDGELKIIDFGLAKEDPRVTVALTVTGAWFGTLGCMSPEQCKHPGNVDHRTDFFGLGRTFAAALQQLEPAFVDLEHLPRPWKEICRTLCAYEANNRPADGDKAISLVMKATVAAGIPPNELLRHAKEAAKNGMPDDGWPEFCAHYFREALRRDALTHDDIRAAAKLGRQVFADAAFDGDGLFEAIEDGPLGELFSTGASSFEGVDPFGQYLAKAYPYLSGENQIRCWRRLVRTAVDYHRYPLMALVRSVYRDEPGEKMRARLIEVLVAEDPDGDIEGRGSIPIPQSEPVSGAA